MSATDDQSKMQASWDLAFGLASSTVDRGLERRQAATAPMRPAATQAAIDASWDRAFAQAQAEQFDAPSPPAE